MGLKRFFVVSSVAIFVALIFSIAVGGTGSGVGVAAGVAASIYELYVVQD